MKPAKLQLLVACTCALLACRTLAADEPADEHSGPADERNLVELRDTVVNLLQALVERGILTREQAEAMIRDAKAKAEAELAANAAQQKQQEKEEQGAVRVPYVPQIVKDQISQQVVTELGPSMKQEVMQQITSTDSLRSVLPGWVQRMTWTGDVRFRGESDYYARDNVFDSYLDFNAVNAAGGKVKAGTKEYLDTTEDRDRLRLRLRFGFDTDLGSGWDMGMRVGTGTGEVFPTTNQTLGTYGQAYQIALDQGYVRWSGQSSSGRQIFSTTAGRFANPWLSTDMVWYNDLSFEGVASNYRLNLNGDQAHRHDLFVTLGAFPLQDLTPSSQDKWLLAGQLGADLNGAHGARLQLGAAYYDYAHIVGQRNAPGSTLLNYTAPALLQKGNTLYDISDSTDPTVNLFALAAEYRIVNLIAVGELPVFAHYALTMTADAADNIGYNSAAILARTGTYVAPRTRGYQANFGFGSAGYGADRTWRAQVGYRYLERDAVLDAFNDEDFHLGGTDAKGYILTFDYAINPRVWAQVKYMSADAIDGPPLGIDVLQIDLNGRF